MSNAPNGTLYHVHHRQQRRTLALAAEKKTGDIYQNSSARANPIESKQCPTCDIERPSLASHCSQVG
jgi:hypothetical protein